MTTLKFCMDCESWHPGIDFGVKKYGVLIGRICRECNHLRMRKIHNNKYQNTMPLPEDEVFQGAELPPAKPSLLNYRRDDQAEETPEEAELNEFELKTDQPEFEEKKQRNIPTWVIIDNNYL